MPTTFEGCLCQVRVIQARECAGSVDSSNDLARVLGHMSRLSGVVPVVEVAGDDAKLFAAVARFHDALSVRDVPGLSDDQFAESDDAAGAVLKPLFDIPATTIGGVLAKALAVDAHSVGDGWNREGADAVLADLRRLPGAAIGAVVADDSAVYLAIERLNSTTEAWFKLDEVAEPKEGKAASDLRHDTFDALISLRPTTLPGVLAKAWTIHEDTGGDFWDGESVAELLDEIRRAMGSPFAFGSPEDCPAATAGAELLALRDRYNARPTGMSEDEHDRLGDETIHEAENRLIAARAISITGLRGQVDELLYVMALDGGSEQPPEYMRPTLANIHAAFDGFALLPAKASGKPAGISKAALKNAIYAMENDAASLGGAVEALAMLTEKYCSDNEGLMYVAGQVYSHAKNLCGQNLEIHNRLCAEEHEAGRAALEASS